MTACRICCDPLEGGGTEYHPACARRLFGHRSAPRVPYTWQDLNSLAEQIVRRSVAVPGVQPKLSLHLEKGGTGPDRFTLVGLEGEFILKPPVQDYPEMPELEHLCMLLARTAGMDVAACGLVSLVTGESAFITRRMDRAHDRVLHMEDMCQLTDRMTEEKYRASLEQVGRAILTYSQNPGLDALRLFELTLFCFLTGNSDMHLKNFSLIYEADGLVHLAPAYDLLPTQLLLPEDREETALTLNGKKNRLARGDFAALAKSLELTERQIANVYARTAVWLQTAEKTVHKSFVSNRSRHEFLALLSERRDRLGLS